MDAFNYQKIIADLEAELRAKQQTWDNEQANWNAIAKENELLQAKNAKLRLILKSLSNEFSTLSAFEIEVREVVGNTNYCCIREKVNSAREVLLEQGETE